jgi:hypothetical protein
MPLSINPIAQLVSSVSQSIQQATNEAQASLPSASSLSKLDLDKKISALSGGIGSGLNGLTGDIKNLAGTAAGALGGISGLGNISSVVQSKVGGVLNTLQSVTGSTSNIAADITGGLNKLTGGSLAGGLMSLAGDVSKAAGMLNNILSLKRGANIPSGAEAFLKQGTAIKLQPGSANDWRVRINAQWNLFNSPLFKLLENTGGVVWPYMPNITVATKAEYDSKSMVHSNYQVHSYKSSSIDDITITGEFSCETETDAAYWIAATTFFKTATKMFFGKGDHAGNPPLVCNLTGYGASIFDNVPVIIKSFSVDLKDDTNYIRCNTFGTNTWVPVLSTVTVVVAPIYNRQRLRQFNLQDYSRGKMAGSGNVGYL